MKKLAKVEEVENEGLISLLGEDVLLICVNYFYKGKLVGVNDDFVKLENPHIVYDTGAWSNKTYDDCQSLCTKEHYIQKASIESFGRAK